MPEGSANRQIVRNICTVLARHDLTVFREDSRIAAQCRRSDTRTVAA
jgi:hypothetical protein